MQISFVIIAELSNVPHAIMPEKFALPRGRILTADALRIPRRGRVRNNERLRKCSGRLRFPSRDPASRCYLDGNSHSSRSTARNFPAGGFDGRTELLPPPLPPSLSVYISVPCESVILV